jgi:hypothetical protein
MVKQTKGQAALRRRRRAAATWWSEERRQTGQGLRSRHGACGAVIHHSDRSPLRAHQVRHKASAPWRRRRRVVRIRGCRGVDTSAAVTGSFSVRGGQAQVVACGRTLRFYPSVYSPKRSASFKLLPRAVRPFHARLGTSLPSKASAATGVKRCNIELCSVHAGKFPECPNDARMSERCLPTSHVLWAGHRKERR